jgi:hypothetical protein
MSEPPTGATRAETPPPGPGNAPTGELTVEQGISR